MSKNENGAKNYCPNTTQRFGRSRGRGSTDSRTISESERTWIGADPTPGESSTPEADNAAGRLLTDGGQVATEDMADALSLVIASRYRRVVVAALRDGPATPSTIADETDVDIAHVSRALQRLREADLATLLVDEERKKGRVYALTDGGEQLVETYGDAIRRQAAGEPGWSG